jgi:hypothetical protein
MGRGGKPSVLYGVVGARRAHYGCHVIRAVPLSWPASVLAFLWSVVSFACSAEFPPRGPEETCAKACAARAPQCTTGECARGCNLVLDRLVEHEGDHVVVCVAKGGAVCDDRRWARCAALIGAHADGGPPPPTPARGELEE